MGKRLHNFEIWSIRFKTHPLNAIGVVSKHRNIWVRSEQAGRRVMGSITWHDRRREFLGFGFTAGPEVKRVIAPKALDHAPMPIKSARSDSCQLASAPLQRTISRGGHWY
jgi:hypothetical protein